MITDVKLTSCVSGSLLKRGALVPRRWVELHGGGAATGRCSSAFWRKLTQAVQMEHGLGNRGSAVCALFFVQRFALLPGTPLEAQLRRDPPARLVRVNGTVVREKAGSDSAGRRRRAVALRLAPTPPQKRPPHAAASAPASRNHTAVHKAAARPSLDQQQRLQQSRRRHITNVCRQHQERPRPCAEWTCGGTGCSKHAEGFTCCKGEILDTCTSPHQHTCRSSAFTEQHDEHDQGHDEQFTIKDTIKNTINNTINNTTDREDVGSEWGGEANHNPKKKGWVGQGKNVSVVDMS